MNKILFFIVLLASCNSKKNADTAYKLELLESKTIKFKLDNRTSYLSMYINTFSDVDKSDKLVFLGYKKPSILFYNIENQKLENEILLEKEGPNGVGSPTGILVESRDSIFVISSSQYLISKIDRSGKVMKNIRTLSGNAYGDETGMIRPFTISPPIKLGDSIFLNVAPDRDVYKPTFFDGKVNLVVNFKTGKWRYFNSYPDEFKGHVWGVTATNFSTAFNKNKFVYSFAISDSIRVFDIVSKRTDTYFAGSSYITTPINSMKIPDNNHDLEYVLETPYYEGIVYDKYRDIYYRFVKHKIDFKSNSNSKINGFFDKPISVIILNNKFQVIGETSLKKDKYLSHIYFVGKDGLYISNGNPNNPDLDENNAVFTCFKINKIEH